MTLILGVKCSDGCVLAADSAATAPYIEHKTRKLHIVNDSMVLGTSGSLGLSQRFVWELGRYWCGGEAEGKEPTGVMTDLSACIRNQLVPDMIVDQHVPASASELKSGWLSSTVVAVPIGDTVHLFRFDAVGHPMEHTESLPFVSIGSGTYAGDPFLKFISRLLWIESPPPVHVAIFSVVWTLFYAIQTCPSGVAGPIQVVTMTTSDGKTNIAELSPAEVGYEVSVVQDTEKRIAEECTVLRDTAPAPPTPPPATTG